MSWTLQAIADELGVSKGSVSVWVRDVEFVPTPRNRGHASQHAHPMRARKLEEIERCRVEAEELIGALSERDLEMFALALYAGEGSKTDGGVVFANTDAALVLIFLTWLRSAFEIDETRLRVRLYLHADLELEPAIGFWSTVLDVPPEQFSKPYRPDARAVRRLNRRPLGCATVVYSCSLTHRRVMARIAAVASRFDLPG